MANVGIGFFIALILGRLLGAEGYGVIAFGMSIATLFSAWSRFGAPIFVARMTAQYDSERNDAQLNAIFRFSLLCLGATSILVCIAGMLFFKIAGGAETRPIYTAGFIGAIIAPIISLQSLGQGFLRGFMKPARAYIPEFLVVQLLTLTAIIFLHGARALTPVTALLGFGAAWLIASLFCWGWTLNAWPKSCGKIERAPIAWRQWTSACALIFVGSLMGITIGRMELAALAAFATPQEIGIYAIAFRFAALVTFPAFAVSTSLGPTISKLNAKGDTPAMMRRIRISALSSTLLATLAALFVSLSAWVILPYIHSEFSGARQLVIILSAGFIVQAMSGGAQEILNMLGKTQRAAYVSLLSISCFAVLMAILIPAYGAKGAAYATSIIIAVHSIALSWLTYRETGLRCDIFSVIDIVSAKKNTKGRRAVS